MDSINNCIAHDVNILHAALFEVSGRLYRWCKMNVCHLRNQSSVQFFGVGISKVKGSQSGFHVSNLYTMVERHLRQSPCGCGITLNDNNIEVFL